MKLVLLKDVDGNEFIMAPSSIVKIVESGNHSIVETIDGIITTESEKLIIANAIHDCYLP